MTVAPSRFLEIRVRDAVRFVPVAGHEGFIPCPSCGWLRAVTSQAVRVYCANPSCQRLVVVAVGSV